MHKSLHSLSHISTHGSIATVKIISFGSPETLTSRLQWTRLACRVILSFFCRETVSSDPFANAILLLDPIGVWQIFTRSAFADQIVFANSICNLRPAFIAKPVGSDDVSSVNRRCDGTIMGGSGCELVGESFKMFIVQVSRDSVCIIRSLKTNRFSMWKIISMGGRTIIIIWIFLTDGRRSIRANPASGINHL